jgi:rod shape-determining protein MreC
MSLAILFAHPDFRVSAMSADGSAFGIVQPHVTSSSTSQEQTYLRSERYLLEMRGVPFRATLKKGAVVFSSGLGGIYPKGIPVGVVLDEIKTPESWARTYLLRPAVNPAELTSVMILTPQRGSEALTNIWGDVGAIDSATKGVVAAGADLARQAATAEAAARRAAIDSLARQYRDSVLRDSARADSVRQAAARAAGDLTVPPARPVVDPEVLRARRDSALARARRDSVRRARAADSVARQAAPAPVPAPATPPGGTPTPGARQ